MSLKRLYSVYDEKAKYFTSPFTHRSDDEAKREFGAAVKNSKTAISQYPGDFKLYVVGTYDDSTGSVEKISPAEYLAVGSDYEVSEPAEVIGT